MFPIRQALGALCLGAVVVRLMFWITDRDRRREQRQGAPAIVDAERPV